MPRPRVGPREGLSSECQRVRNALSIPKESGGGCSTLYDTEYNV
jgi:hypothetical protein